MTANRTVAIITPYGLFNYGNRLQNWAVDRLLRDEGYKPETLVLRNDYRTGIVRDAKLHIGHMLRLRGSASVRYKNFREFDRQIKKHRIYSASQLASVGKKLDAFVIGSDQIWNPHQVDFKGAEYANMAPENRIMSLSASIGLEELPESKVPSFVESVSRIPYLSVREHSGAEIIQKYIGRDAHTLVDPTLALTSEVWGEQSSTRMAPSGDYVVYYLLGSYSDVQRKNIHNLDLSQQGKPVALFDRSEDKYYEAGPQDFLGLIQNAKAVITDSYHAVAFALQFGVPCKLINRAGLNYSMNSRFETLASKLNLNLVPDASMPQARLVETQDDSADLLISERELFLQFLRDSLTDLAAAQG